MHEHVLTDRPNPDNLGSPSVASAADQTGIPLCGERLGADARNLDIWLCTIHAF